MHSWRNTSFSINLYFCSKFLCQNVDRNINIKCKTFHEDAGEPRQVQGWLGCLWKGLDIRVTTQWEDHKMDGPHPTPTPHKQNQCFIQNLSQRIWRTKAGTRVIGVSMERSWHKGHHTMDGPPHPTPPPIPTKKTQNQCYKQNLSRRAWRNQGYEGDWGVYRKVFTSGKPQNGLTPPPHHPTPQPQTHKINILCKTCPQESGETKAGTRVIMVSMERSWPQGHHTMDGPHPTSNTLSPHPTPKTKINVTCKTCAEEPGESKAGTRVIGMSMERSWPQGHHTDGCTSYPSLSTPPPHTCKINIICKTWSQRICRNQGRHEGD